MNKRTLCAECKGRGLCGLPKCPVTSRFHATLKMKRTDSYMGDAPSVFVGSRGYPNMSGGPLLINESDSPKSWLSKGYTIEEIVGVRAQTIRGSSDLSSLTLEGQMQEIALSDVPLDVEVSFKKPVLFDLKFDGTLAPVGLAGDIKKLDVLDNGKTSRAVDRITSDTDMRATEAVSELYKEGIDVYHISQLLTSGLLGVKRHLVPTKWGITAVDDMVSARLRKDAARFPPLQSVQVLSATLYGNQIICILIPGDWKYEMIEIWEKNSLWSQESDTIICDGERRKKKGYSPIAGAYYSGRLAVADHLNRLRRAAGAIIIRRITGEYWAPLGTWVIREATRKAMEAKPVQCNTLQDAVRTASGIMGSDKWVGHSRLVPEIMTQKSLFDF